MERGKRLARWLAPAGWYAVIWFFSSQVGEESQDMSDGVLTNLFGLDLANMNWDVMLLMSFLVRKAAHMGVFFILTGLLLWALKPWLAGRRAWPWAALGLCGVLAVSDELHQRFVPGRSGLPRDVCIDLLGGGCFLLCWWALRAIGKRRNGKKDPAG